MLHNFLYREHFKHKYLQFGPIIALGAGLIWNLKQQAYIDSLKKRVQAMADANPSGIIHDYASLCQKVIHS